MIRMSVAGLLTVASTTLAQPTDSLPRPTPQQLAWHELELGTFIHLAPQTWQDSESDTMATPLSALNPERLDAEQWVRVAESMGAKYLVFVAKHEGGFCWWPTETTDYSVRSIPWRGGRGDVMRELSDAGRLPGLLGGVSLAPRHRWQGWGGGGRAADPAKQAAYESMFRTQLTELLTWYGPIMEVWFDGSLVFDVGDILAAHAPDAVVFQGPQASIRWVGNEDGIAPYPAWNAVRFGAKPWGHYTAAEGDPDGDRWLPNECDARIRSTWFWRTDNASSLKSVAQLMDMYERSVGHGGVLLLNHTPDRTGLIPEADARRAAEFGAEIERTYGRTVARMAGGGTELELALPEPVTIDRIVTMEDIRAGERVRRYAIEGQAEGVWRELASGTAIGHMRIDRFEPVSVAAVRLRVIESVGEPVIRRFSLHQGRGAEGALLGGTPSAVGRAGNPPPIRPHPDLPGYALAWHDEFDGPNLDSTRWSHYAPGPRRDAVNTPEAVTLDGMGHLVITTSRHEVPDPDSPGRTRPEIRTGMISTRGLYETTHGYFECRMKLQREVGHWSAFWINTPTMGNPVGDPAAAGVEIDVIEYLRNGSYPDKAQHTIHWDHKTPRYQRDFAAPVVPDIGEGFHTFGCEWTPEHLAFFVDGRETWRTSAAIPSRDQHLILSLEVGKWADDIAGASLPDSIEVDYVRVFKRP